MYGQTTPGLIYKPAEGDGQLILNPNEHGFASETTAGFTWSDVEESEIPYHPLPQFEVEQIGDVRTGASGGHTDLADNGQKQTAFMYYDGENLLFRVRLGGQSTSSKGYSFFFNTAFETFGPKGGNFSSVNPGFQFEIVLETGNGVQIYELDGESPVLRQTLDLSQHHQRAISYTHLDGSTGFFYDFYVPVSEIESAIPGFTFNSSTDFRAAAATITRSQSGITGTLSDINGINDSNYSNTVQALTDITESTQSVNLNDIGEEGSGFGDIVQQTRIPSISSPILNGADTVSGFINEEDGATVQVYRDGSYWTTADPSSSYAWTATADALATDEVITARAQFGSKDWSEFSSGVTVTEAGVLPTCTSIPTTLATAQGGPNERLTGTVPDVPGGTTNADLVVRGYGPDGVLLFSTDASDSAPTTVTYHAELTAGDFDLANPGTNSYYSGLSNLFVTAQVTGQCESDFSARFNATGTQTDPPPVITSTDISPSTDIITGTATTTADIYLYLNDTRNQIGFLSNTEHSGIWSISDFSRSLEVGDVVFARARVGTNHMSQQSNKVLVEDVEPLEPSNSPVISGSYAAGSNITISG
ncbi:MAG: hypothetical protein WEC12_05310, partial [Balneolaceae bacterium]